MSAYAPLLAALVALLAGLAIGKAWERYKLRDGRWIDRRKARESPHYILGLNFLVANQIDLAIEEKLIQKSGAWFALDGENVGQGRENTRQYLREHPEICESLRKQILERRGANWTGSVSSNGKEDGGDDGE